MELWLVYVQFLDNPDVMIQGLIRGKDGNDAIDEAMRILLMDDRIMTIDVDTDEPFTPDDIYLTDLDGTPVYSPATGITNDIEYYQIQTGRFKPTRKELDELIQWFESTEQYERCGELLTRRRKKRR